jgi:hypothetical protein
MDQLRLFPELELMKIEEGVQLRYLSTPALTQKLRDAGLAPTVLIEDLEGYYAGNRMLPNFGLLLTYSETVALMDALHASYPNLTTDKISIGTTWQGRDIWAMKISDNPNLEEGEPEVLFDALHHAREPITVSVLIDLMYYLCDNYGVESEATFLVDNRQIWFVPIVNPDGYVYNEQTNPNGGGMWRKNRREQGACDGVDLNRNYGYQWGGAGSDSDPCSEVYRGPSAFSEPETQAVRDFIREHEFVTQDSYHSVVGVVLFPWGYTTSPTPDDALFRAIAAERVRESGYAYGQIGPDLYLASGVMCDWAYGEQLTKPKIMSFTTEVGGSGFWPADSEVAGLVAENHYSNIYLSQVAGAYVAMASAEVVGGDGDGALDPGESVDLVVTVENAGVLVDAEDVTVTLGSDDAYVQLHDASASYGTIGAGESASNAGDPFGLTVDASTPEGHVAVFRLTTEWAGGGRNEEVLSLTVGSLPVILADDFESGNNGWTEDASHTALVGDWVIVDPNPTGYQPGDDTTPPPGVRCWVTAQNSSEGTDDVDNGISAIRSPDWDLSGVGHVRMAFNYFFGQRDPGDDPTGDFFRVEVSNDGGATYPATLISIGDVFNAATWQPFEVRLEDVIPLTDRMVLRFQASDGPATGDIVEAGFDDLQILDTGTGNTPPTAPALASPADGATDVPASAVLTVWNSTDADGDPLSYGFRVYSDALLTNPVRSIDGVPSGTLQTSWTVSPPLPQGTYWWRAYAADPEERGEFMSEASFTVGESVGVPAGDAFAASFMPASPNPFAARTSVRFLLPEPSRVRAEVFDLQGRLVRTLYRGLLQAGPQAFAWDGLDGRGRRSSAGEYFVQVTVNGRVNTQKVIVLD